MTDVVGVTGGVAGVAASYAAARELAAECDRAADRVRGWAGTATRAAADADLLESGLLAPDTCASAELALLAAAAGPCGLLPASLGWEATAVAVRSAIAHLEAADQVVQAAVTALDQRLALLALGVAATPTGAVALGGLAASGDLEEALTDHPELLQHLANGLGGLALAAGVAYGGSGRPVVTPYGGAATGRQPQTVHELVEHLQDLAALSDDPDSPANGTIEVQTVTGPGGEVRHIVNLPGTDDFNAPWVQDGDVRDLESGLDAMTGQPDAYQQGILEAMALAGVRPEEPVLLVGHSLGGMEAAAILAADGPFTVTDVVTAGSPTAQVPGFPAGSNVLSLEQQGDVVPQLDGRPNPDSVEQTTVVFDADPAPGVTSHHYYGPYLQGAAAVDASRDPSVAAAVQSLHDHGFLGADGEVTNQVFQITRD